MPRYIDRQARARAQKRKQQKARRMAMYSSVVLFILVVSFGITTVIRMFQKDDGNQPLLDIPGTQQDQTGENQPAQTTYVMGPQTADVTLPLVSPDISTAQTTANGRVDVSYFNDAIFMGDSLADGFKDYVAWMSLKDTTAMYMTQRSMTPRTFVQPGARVDAGKDGTVDVWQTITDRQPGKIYITLGTNALMFSDPQELVDSYYQLVGKIRSTSPDTLIYITTIPPTSSSYAAQETRLSKERILQANQLIAQMCREKNLALINLYDVVAGADGYLNEEINADGIHLTPNGYKMWLNYLIEHTVYNPDSPYIPGSPYHKRNIMPPIEA